MKDIQKEDRLWRASDRSLTVGAMPSGPLIHVTMEGLRYLLPSLVRPNEFVDANGVRMDLTLFAWAAPFA